MRVKSVTQFYAKSWRIAVGLIVLGGSAAVASAQYAPGGLAPRDSGYNAFYPDQEDAPGYAAHWGFHDGFADGSHDRETGHSFRPTHDDKYEDAPEYGHPPIRRNDYKNIYREAYVRGYVKGYGR